MEALLQGLEASGLAEALRFSRWSYAAASTAHVLGIALLVGAIVPLDLRLLGAFPRVPVDALARVLVPVAAAGLALAALAGGLLFSVRAGEYAGLGIFRLKIALVAAGLLAALALHASAGRLLRRAGPRRLAVHGALSLACWLPALVLGRLVAFA